MRDMTIPTPPKNPESVPDVVIEKVANVAKNVSLYGIAVMIIVVGFALASQAVGWIILALVLGYAHAFVSSFAVIAGLGLKGIKRKQARKAQA